MSWKNDCWSSQKSIVVMIGGNLKKNIIVMIIEFSEKHCNDDWWKSKEKCHCDDDWSSQEKHCNDDWWKSKEKCHRDDD